MTLEQIGEIIQNTHYKGWQFEITELNDQQSILVKPVFRSNNHNEKGYMEQVEGRNWYLNCDMSESEIVKTLWLAVKTAEEHEMRKSFTYRGYRIFDPMININDLEEVAPTKKRKSSPDLDF